MSLLDQELNIANEVQMWKDHNLAVAEYWQNIHNTNCHNYISQQDKITDFDPSDNKGWYEWTQTTILRSKKALLTHTSGYLKRYLAMIGQVWPIPPNLQTATAENLRILSQFEEDVWYKFNFLMGGDPKFVSSGKTTWRLSHEFLEEFDTEHWIMKNQLWTQFEYFRLCSHICANLYVQNIIS
jgi:hypothetical protein